MESSEEPSADLDRTSLAGSIPTIQPIPPNCDS